MTASVATVERGRFTEMLLRCRRSAAFAYSDPNPTMSRMRAKIHFEQDGSRLTAIEIVRGMRSPLISTLHRTLFALGIVVSSYSVRASAFELVERIVIERQDGGSVDGSLTEATKAAILPLALALAGAEAGGDLARTV